MRMPAGVVALTTTPADACYGLSVTVTTHLPLMGPPKPIHTAQESVAPAELCGK